MSDNGDHNIPHLMDTIATQGAEVTTLKSEVAALRGQVHALQEEVHRLKSVLHGPAPQRYRIDKKLEGHTGKILALYWLADELLVSAADDDTARIWDVTTGQCLHTLDNVSPCLGVLSSGQHILTIDGDSLPLEVQLWDALSGRCLRTSSLSGPVIQNTELDDNGDDYSRWENGTTTNAAYDDCMHISAHIIVPRRKFQPGDDGTPYQPPSVIFSGERSKRASPKHSRKAKKSSTTKASSSSGSKTHRMQSVGASMMIRSNTSRNLLATLADMNGADEGSQLAHHHVHQEHESRNDTDQQVTDMQDKDNGISGSDFDIALKESMNMPSDWLIVGGEDCLLRVMDISTGSIVRVLEGHYQTITSLAIVASDVDVSNASYTGKFSQLIILSASMDMTIRVWDVLAGNTLAILSGHHSTIRCLSVLPPEALSSQKDSAFSFRTSPATSTAVDEFNKIEAYVVSGSEGGSLRLWALRNTIKPRKSANNPDPYYDYRNNNNNNFYDPANFNDDDDGSSSDSDNDESDFNHGHFTNPFNNSSQPPHHLSKQERRRYGKCECLASIDNGHVESITCLQTMSLQSSSSSVPAGSMGTHPMLTRSTSWKSSSNDHVSSSANRTVSVISGSEDTTLRVWSVRTMMAEYDYEYCLLLQGHRAKINFTIPLTLPPLQSVFTIISAQQQQQQNLSSKLEEIVDDHISLPPVQEETLCQPSAPPLPTLVSSKSLSRLLTATSSSFYFYQNDQGPSSTTEEATTALSAGQPVILSGSDDGTMVLWDVHSGDALHTLHGHIDSVQCAIVLDQLEYVKSNNVDDEHSNAMQRSNEEGNSLVQSSEGLSSHKSTHVARDENEDRIIEGNTLSNPSPSQQQQQQQQPHRHHVLVSGGSRGVLYTWTWS